MKESIILLRALNLFYHHMHNVAYGCSFMSDHKMLADLYDQLDDEYDALTERFIGRGGILDKSMSVDIIRESADFLANMPDSSDMRDLFSYAIELEGLLSEQLEKAMEGASKGTENLLQDLADKGEARMYLLKQRTKHEESKNQD